VSLKATSSESSIRQFTMPLPLQKVLFIWLQSSGGILFTSRKIRLAWLCMHAWEGALRGSMSPFCKIDTFASRCPPNVRVSKSLPSDTSSPRPLMSTSTFGETGGADWIRESKKWEQEQLQEWESVIRNRRPHQHAIHVKVTFCDNLIQDSPVKKSIPMEISNNMRFGEFICPIKQYTSSIFPRRSGRFQISNHATRASVAQVSAKVGF
jgi:hypothetical protein